MDRIEVNARTGEQTVVQLTPQEETAAMARTAAQLPEFKDAKYAIAQDQFKIRATAIHGIDPTDQLYELGQAMKKANKRARGASSQSEIDELDAQEGLQEQVGTLRDKYDTLKDAIEAAATVAAVEAIDPTDNTHWS